MKESLIDSIHRQEERLFNKKTSWFLRILIYSWLFVLYLLFAAHRALYLLFASHNRSFFMNARKNTDGTWADSYHKHIELQRGVRFFSLSTMLMIVVSSVALLTVMQLVFPASNTEPAQAADNTYTVINNNNAGVGSLRTAINSANVASGTVEIVFDIIGTNQISLVTALPDLTNDVTFTNNEIAPVRIDGSSLVGSTDCWEIASGSEGTTIVGMAFVDCTGNGLVVSADSITIGGSATADNVYAYGNNSHGVSVSGSNNTIQHLYSGWPLTVGGTDGNIGSGLYVSGDDNTIDAIVALQNSQYGIHIDSGADGNTITNSYIGIRSTLSSSSVGNTSDGIRVEGDSTTIGTSGNGNVVSQNGAQGIHIVSASGATITDNSIGVNEDQDEVKSNSEAGIYLDNATSASVSGNVISGNTGAGVYIDAGSGHSIFANYIGTNSANVSLGNQTYGVLVENGTTSTTIGGATAAYANTISYNSSDGIHLATVSTSGIEMSRNIFSENGGDPITISDSANNGIEAPEIIGAGSPAISGRNATEGSVVQIYADGAYLGEESSVPVSGEWQLDADEASLENFDAYNGLEITALQTDTSNNTSEFSGAVNLTTEPATVTVTDSATFTSSIDITATLEGGGSLYYTTDGTTPTTNSTEIEDELSLTITETTTLKIFGVDTNNNETDVQSETYTKESDTGGDGNDGGGDGSGDGNGDGGTEPQPIEVDYLKPTNITVNGLKVYSGKEEHYTPVDDITIAGKKADDDNQVQVIIERKKTGTSVDTRWVEVNSFGHWKRTVGIPLKKAVKYRVLGRAREIDENATASATHVLATIVPSNPAPSIVTLTDGPNVTAKPEEIVFSGVFQGQYEDAKFRVLNEKTGELAASCAVQQGQSTNDTNNGSCTLDTELPPAEYRVLFHSVEDALLSAPDDALLTVTYPVARSTLNLDSRSADFAYRITTTSTPALVGIGPEDAVAKVYLDDTFQGEAEYTSAIGWEYVLNLQNTSRGDHTITVKFFQDGIELVDDSIDFDFKYAAAPVNIQLRNTIPGEVSSGQSLAAQLVGGLGDLVTMQHTGSSPVSITLNDSIGNNLAQKTVLLPTDTRGTHRVTFQSENSIGLQSRVLQIAYTVVSQSSGGGSNTEEEEQPTETIEEPDTEENENTPPDTNEEPVDNEGEQPITDPIIDHTKTDTVTLSDGTVIPVESIPTQWLTPPQNDQERKEIETRLQQFNTKLINVVAHAVVRDDQGNILSQDVLEQNADGVTVLHHTRVSGVDYVIPGLEKKEEQAVEFSGITDPYAEVKLTIHSDPIVQFTRADETGKWTMNVAVAALPAGEHSAYVQTTSKGVDSEEVEIAKFVVVEEERISTTTWLFIVNILIIIIFLLVAVALQFRHRMKQMDKYSTPPIAKKDDGIISSKEAKIVESIAKASEKDKDQE